MGMYCQLSSISAEQLRELDDGPEAIEGFEQTVSLEKAWHGLHYLLTGSAFEGEGPLGFLLQGGEPLDGDPDEGGPRLFSPAEVQQINAALAGVSDDTLWGNFDPDDMNAQGIYPTIWDEPEADLREEYLMYFHQMKDLFAQASKKKQGVVIDVG